MEAKDSPAELRVAGHATRHPPDGGGADIFLAELDRTLSRALAHAANRDPDLLADKWRGLHLDASTVERIVAHGGLLAQFAETSAALAAAARQYRPLAVLADLYGLSDFAVATIALAIAPELDERYGRIFGFLQDDVTRKLPTPSLTLDLFCVSADERARCRNEFASGGALVAHGILELQAVNGESSLTDRLKIDVQIRQFLLAEPGLDPRLASFCSLRAPQADIEELPLDSALKAALKAAAAGLRRSSPVPLRLCLSGAAGGRHDRIAEALSAAAGMTLLRVDMRALAQQPGDLSRLFAVLRREALLANAVVDLAYGEAIGQEQHAYLRDVLTDQLQRFAPAIVISSTPNSWLAAAAAKNGFVPIALDVPSSALRRRAWREHLARADLTLPSDDLKALASRFRLNAGEIEQAVMQAAATLRWRKRMPSAADRREAARDACFAAARAQGGYELARLAQRITPRFSWDDIVVPEAVTVQLREICERIALGETVLETWRFADKLSLGRGVSALFAGPSGTGKTMAAEIIAGAVGIDLFKINLASVLSKYIGETEQNLDRIFRAAEDVSGILLFDEADALFGKRSEVRDSRDRYANLEISYLLQKMEEFEGVAILSSNLHNNLDDAFLRRLSFIVYFPFPEPADRRRIWDVVWPQALPRDPSIDFGPIAQTFKLSGGNIKSAALAAAYYAAAEGRPVAHDHIIRAIEREFQKMGRPLRAEEIAPLLRTGATRS